MSIRNLLSEDRATLKLSSNAVLPLPLEVVLALFWIGVALPMGLFRALTMAGFAVRTNAAPLSGACVFLKVAERKEFMAAGTELGIKRDLHEGPGGEVILSGVAASAKDPDRAVLVMLKGERQGCVAVIASPEHLPPALGAEHGFWDCGLYLGDTRNVFLPCTSRIAHCADSPVKDAELFPTVGSIDGFPASTGCGP